MREIPVKSGKTATWAHLWCLTAELASVRTGVAFHRNMIRKVAERPDRRGICLNCLLESPSRRRHCGTQSRRYDRLLPSDFCPRGRKKSEDRPGWGFSHGRQHQLEVTIIPLQAVLPGSQPASS